VHPSNSLNVSPSALPPLQRQAPSGYGRAAHMNATPNPITKQNKTCSRKKSKTVRREQDSKKEKK
jgi:hypothetical protein